MDIKSITSTRTNAQTTKVLLLAILVMAGSALNGWSGPAEDKAKGEEMLRQARVDIAEANRLSEASIKASEIAQLEQVKANDKRLAARKLEREAFLLIRDSSRMKDVEARARAEGEELQVKTETVELKRLEGLLAHQKQTVVDTTGAAAKIQDAVKNETNPAEKAELSKMADSLTRQGVEAGNEEVAIERRIAPIQAEISRLQTSITMLNVEAKRLAPQEK